MTFMFYSRLTPLVKAGNLLDQVNIMSKILKNTHVVSSYTHYCKGSDLTRLVFAHPFLWNNGAPVAPANCISDGKVQVASSYTLMMELAQLMGAQLFNTNGWAQSSPFPVSPFITIELRKKS